MPMRPAKRVVSLAHSRRSAPKASVIARKAGCGIAIRKAPRRDSAGRPQSLTWTFGELREIEHLRQPSEGWIVGPIERRLAQAEVIDDQLQPGKARGDARGLLQPAGDEQEQRHPMLRAGGEHRIPGARFEPLHFAPVERPADQRAQVRRRPFCLAPRAPRHRHPIVGRDMRHVLETIGQFPRQPIGILVMAAGEHHHAVHPERVEIGDSHFAHDLVPELRRSRPASPRTARHREFARRYPHISSPSFAAQLGDLRAETLAEESEIVLAIAKTAPL